jgi:hypothetical protein
VRTAEVGIGPTTTVNRLDLEAGDILVQITIVTTIVTKNMMVTKNITVTKDIIVLALTVNV